MSTAPASSRTAALLADRRRDASPRISRKTVTSTGSDGWLASHLSLALGVLAILVAALTAFGASARATYGARTTADEPHYLLTAISLAEDHNLDISDERASLRYLPFHEVALPQQAIVQPDGSQVAPHDPLLPLLLAAPVAVGGWAGAKLALAGLAGVLAAVVAWTAIRRFGVRPTIAFGVAGVAGLSPPLSMYATQVYPELPGALAVTVAVAALTGRPRASTVAITGAAITALPWLSVKYLGPAAALAVVAAVRWWRHSSPTPPLAARSLVGVFAAGLALMGVAYLVAHQAWYGGWTPYAAGDHFVGGELSVVGDHPHYVARSERLAGLLVDRDFGLAVWQPAWLLAVPALAALARRRPPGALALTLPLAAGWLTATFVALTMQGWWWPGRQTVVVLPLAALVVAWWLHGYAPRRTSIVAAALGLLGVVAFAFLVVEGATSRLTWVIDFARTGDPLVRLARPLLPNLRVAGAGTTLRQLSWTALLAVLAVVGWRSATPPSARRR